MMSQFLSASLIHHLPRFDSHDSDVQSMASDNQQILDLIAKISKNHDGVVQERTGNQVIYVFKEIELATQAAISIQRELDLLNESNHLSPIHLVSTGIDLLINPIAGAEEERSIQMTAFMAQSAGVGELYLSEGAFEALQNPDTLLCRFTRQLLKAGEDQALNAYEVFWNPAEVDLGSFHQDPHSIDAEIQPTRSFGLKLLAGILLLFFGVLLLTVGYSGLWFWFSQMVNR
jgi:hypothetical protein